MRVTPKVAPLRENLDIAPLPRVDGGFKTVLADPPWRFQNRTGKVAPEHRRLDRYSTMSLEEIKSLPVSEVVSDNAHLYLWVPNALLPEGLQVMEAWGFRYVSNIVWAKRRKDGGPDGRGVGFYFRNVTELILFGVRGSMRTLAPARSQVNMIETRKREHSRKPDEQYDLIEQCSPGPFLEMFARHSREEWVTLLVPAVQPHGRLSAKDQAVIGRRLRAEYDNGASIRDLCAQTGYTITRMRTLLTNAGVIFREPGHH